ncbi:hypothetical protein A8924_5446 [Saccharopolyspora erythraea NRRL 2338]|nr:hypothetical protein A8924_5446 [Saccharopolyspora erythraea NRRL 2338]
MRCVAGDGEERGGGHGQGDVAVPGGVAACLVLIESGFVIGALEAFFDRPATARHAHGDKWRYDKRIAFGSEAFRRDAFDVVDDLPAGLVLAVREP